MAFIVWEDRDFMLFLDAKPINPGHLLLITKRHKSGIFALPDSLYSKLFCVAKRAATILKKATRAKRTGLAIEGFGIPHAHVHLVPVNKGNELNPLRAKKMSMQTMEKNWNALRASFGKTK